MRLVILVAAIMFTNSAAFSATVQELLHQGKTAFDENDILDPNNIAHRTYGTRHPDREVVVLIHGLGGDGRTWHELANELSKDFYVVVPETRGHGGTEYDGENFSSSNLSADLMALLDKLNIEKAHLIGHSMGGRTVVRAAAMYPHRVKSVIVEDMHMKGRSKLLDDNLDRVRSLRQGVGQVFSNRTEAKDFLLEENYDEKYSEIILEQVKRWPSKLPFRNSFLSSMLYSPQGLQEDLMGALTTVKCPILFLAADSTPVRVDDKLVQTTAVLFGLGIDLIREQKPDALILEVPGSSHGIHHSREDIYPKIVRNFMLGDPLPSGEELKVPRFCASKLIKSYRNRRKNP